MHNRWHPDIEPVAEVAPGEEIRLEAEDGLAGQLTRESTHADAGRARPRARASARGPGLRPGRGAGPGARGRVRRLRVRRLRRHRGDPRLRLPRRPLHGAVRGQVGDRGRHRALGGAAGRGRSGGALRRRRRRRAVARAAAKRSSRARSGCARRASRLPTRCRRQPCRPRRRRACGRSPRARPAATSTSATSCAGSRLWLPVDVPGALFSAGDIHFAQGDGEVCGTAIEVAGAVTVRFALHDGPRAARCRATRRPRGRSRPRSRRWESRSRRGWT